MPNRATLVPVGIGVARVYFRVTLLNTGMIPIPEKMEKI